MERAQISSSRKAIGPNGASRNIPELTARRVWVAAGGRCTICNDWLLDEQTTGQQVFVGQLAHIVGWDTSDGSPRGSDSLPISERNEADNLLLLCHDQHKVIDSKSLWDVYSTYRLRELKRQHERRIKQLTALGQQDSTTVLRLVDTIHGSAVQLADSAVNEALLDVGRFPSYIHFGADEYEIDLRKVPGEEEGAPLHWAAAVAFIQDRLQVLKTRVANGTVTDLAIFPLARIPTLISLGALLDDTVPATVYPKRRSNNEAWGWPATGIEQDFEWKVIDSGPEEPEHATVVFSVSGSVETARIPTDASDEARIYEIRPSGVTPNFDLVDSPATVEKFARCWRSLLAEIETVPGITAINLVPAVPTTIAVSIGRAVNSAVHPPMRIYDRVEHGNDYVFTQEVPR